MQAKNSSGLCGQASPIPISPIPISPTYLPTKDLYLLNPMHPKHHSIASLCLSKNFRHMRSLSHSLIHHWQQQSFMAMYVTNLVISFLPKTLSWTIIGCVFVVQDMRTYVALSNQTVAEAHTATSGSQEVWGYWPDDEPLKGLHPGDTRAALTPFLAHEVQA